MSYNWYNIFNLTEFLETSLLSRTISVYLEGVGQKDVLVTVGNTNAITYEGEFMPINFADKNPYAYPNGNCAVFLGDNDDVWLGIKVTE